MTLSRPTRIPAYMAAVCALLAAGSQAASPSLDLRLRHESVDDAAFARRAEATTYRLRLALPLRFSERWSAWLEAEHTGHLFGERYNSSANGASGFPLVADPDNTEFNQGWLRYTLPGWQATLGRQRINLGNQRFVGAVGWRQNEQTFDAFDVQWSGESGRGVRYAYLDRVQRIFGDDHPQPLQAGWNLDSHVIEAGTAFAHGRLSALGLWHENRSLPQTSHRNLTLRWDGKLAAGFRYTLEAAQQRPHADGLDRNRASYVAAQAALPSAAGEFSLGWERLGGNGSYAFQTPLATLHAFNGWADRFLSTPADGLRDAYLGWKRGFGGLTASLVLHRYESDTDGRRYGDELDAALSWKLAPQWNVLFKTARYRADSFAADVNKLWVSVEYTR
jgi:hypothetical protein